PLNLNGLYNTTGLVTSWTLNGSSVSNPSSVNTSGNYILIATSAAGCVDTAQVALTVSPAPVLGANQSGSICDGNAQNLTSVFLTGSNSTAWTFNGNPVSNPNNVIIAGAHTM